MNVQINWNDNNNAELKIRLRPLREHWEARGPGMLRQMQTIFPWLSLPEQIEIQLVHPQSGGGGRVISRTQIEFEAVLANRHPQLPEVVRLAWLILCARANARSHEMNAFIPPTLAAAEFVELARCDAPTVDLAQNNWLGDRASEADSKLHSWWVHTGCLSCNDCDAWLSAVSIVPA